MCYTLLSALGTQHRSIPGLASEQASYSPAFSGTLSPAWTTCIPESGFPQPSWRGHRALLVLCLRSRKEAPNILTSSALPALPPQPTVQEAFPTCPGFVGQLCLGTSVNFSATQQGLDRSLGKGRAPPYEFVHPWTFSLSPGYTLEFSLYIYGYSPIIMNTPLC